MSNRIETNNVLYLCLAPDTVTEQKQLIRNLRIYAKNNLPKAQAKEMRKMLKEVAYLFGDGILNEMDFDQIRAAKQAAQDMAVLKKFTERETRLKELAAENDLLREMIAAKEAKENQPI